MKFKIPAIITVLLIAIFLGRPIYGFYSHKGDLPMLPFGQQTLAETSPVQSQVHQANFAEIDARARALIHAHQQAIPSPGLTAAVAIDNQLVWTGQSGFADIDSNVAMTVESLFRIGSTSKALTAAGLARLVQQGHLDLDMPLREVYTNLPNPNWAEITPRQLASHMAGLPHYGQNTDLAGLLAAICLDTEVDNVHSAVALFDDSKLLAKPGERFSYASWGTVLLSDVIQQRLGMSYQQWMQEQVFSPLKLTATMTGTQAKDVANLVTFYYLFPQYQQTFKPWRPVDLSSRLAAGGWVSTSRDLALFGQGFMRDDFIEPEVRREFWTPQRLNNGEINEQNYALGWRKSTLDLGGEIGEIDYYHHGGVSQGAQSFLIAVPRFGLSMALNINTKTESFTSFSKVAKPLLQLFIQAIKA